jgi:hypothetical protein
VAKRAQFINVFKTIRKVCQKLRDDFAFEAARLNRSSDNNQFHSKRCRPSESLERFPKDIAGSLGSGDASQRAQGANRFALLAYDLAHVVGRDTHFDERGSVALFDFANVDVFTIIDQRLDDHLNRVSHFKNLRLRLTGRSALRFFAGLD